MIAATKPAAATTSSASEDVIFASCLDNAHRCFLVLKYVFLPLSCPFGALFVLLHGMKLFGLVEPFSSIFLLHFFVSAAITGSPIVIIPAIVRFRRISASARLTLSHLLFASVCLLAPVLSAYAIWRRRYREVNGFLWVHEFFPTAPPRARDSAASPHEPLSVCDDDYFFVAFVFDHATMMVSRFILPMMFELPPRYFTGIVCALAVLSWASAVRISNIYIHACSNHPISGANAEVAKLYLPLGHMIHLASFLLYMFTALFVSSRNREHNKKWLQSLIASALETTRIHLEAIFRAHDPPKLPQTGTFWSRTEFLYLQHKQQPLLLPAGVGIAFKVSLGLKDWGLYVWALSLPVYFTVFELLRFFTHVDPHICRIVYLSSWKCLVLFILCTLPHVLFSKAIHQGRVRSPWLVSSCCFVVIIAFVMFGLPGATGSDWNRNFRVLPYFIVSTNAAPTILRAISHFASSVFIAVAFVMLHILACYGLYRNYWLPYLAERSPGDSDGIINMIYSSSFAAIFAFNYILLAAQVCICILLDKRHHLQNTGRKFYEAPVANAHKSH